VSYKHDISYAWFSREISSYDSLKGCLPNLINVNAIRAKINSSVLSQVVICPGIGQGALSLLVFYQMSGGAKALFLHKLPLDELVLALSHIVKVIIVD